MIPVLYHVAGVARVARVRGVELLELLRGRRAAHPREHLAGIRVAEPAEEW